MNLSAPAVKRSSQLQSRILLLPGGGRGLQTANLIFSRWNLLIFLETPILRNVLNLRKKFLETLSEISKLAGRWHVIDRQSFATANRYFLKMEYLKEVEIKLHKLFSCKAYGDKLLAIYIDGIMKLYRWLDAQG